VLRTLPLIALLIALPCSAASRSAAAVAEFKRSNPCPSTGARRGKCPKHVVDHRIGICVGGLDRPENMRWMTAAAAKAKDRWECKPGWEERLRDCEQAGECWVR
jgi:hypothetical protein